MNNDSQLADGGNQPPAATRLSLTKVARKVKEKEPTVDSSNDHFEQQQPAASGALNKMQRLQGHSSATVGELREFLGQLKGRSPQEVMGIVAQSSLFQGISTATIGCAVLLAVCTVVPYVLSDGAIETATTTVLAGTVSTPSAIVEPPAAETTAAAEVSTTGEPDLQRAADAMGIGESSPADPNKNPLDSKLDKLLDGID